VSGVMTFRRERLFKPRSRRAGRASRVASSRIVLRDMHNYMGRERRFITVRFTRTFAGRIMENDLRRHVEDSARARAWIFSERARESAMYHKVMKYIMTPQLSSAIAAGRR
jgi:hypothetical protein